MRVLAIVLALLASSAPRAFATGAEPPNQARIFGVFKDAEGKPIAGVELTSRVWPGAEFKTTSAADGTFAARVEWAAHKEGTWYEGTARKLGFARWQKKADLVANQELDLGTIRLEPGGALSGRVTDHEGKALASAYVRVVDAEKIMRPTIFGKDADAESVDRGSTDDEGKFQIVGLRSGRYWVIAQHESTWRDASATYDLVAGQDVFVGELHLDPLPDDHRIEGRVVGPDDKPVAGAKVTTSVHSPRDGRSTQYSATSDLNGRFALYLRHLPDGTLVLKADANAEDLDEAEVSAVQLGARDIVVRLGIMRAFNVLVLGPTGEPVVNFGWSLQVDKGTSIVSSGERAAPRPGGRAVVRVPDQPFWLEIDAPGFNREKGSRFPTGPLPSESTIRLSAPKGVEGVVRYGGHPVADCYVELVAQEPDGMEGLLGKRSTGLYYGWKGTNSRTNADGHFHIASDFPRMKYFVRAWKEGRAEGIAGPVKVGDEPIVVELLDGGSLEGRVTLPGNAAPTGLELELYRKSKSSLDLGDHVGTQFTLRPDADGRYRFEHIPAGPWLLAVKVSGTLASALQWSATRVEEYTQFPYVVAIEERVVQRRDLDLALDDLCRIEGRLQVGEKIREGYCSLVLDGPVMLQVASGTVTRDGKGLFRLGTRDPGRYRLVVNAGPGHHQYKVITDVIDAVSGANNWEKDIPVERWEGKGIRLDAP